MMRLFSLLFTQTIKNIKDIITRIRIQAIFYSIIGFSLFMIFLFGCFSIFLWVATKLDPLHSSLIILAFWILVLLISMLIVTMISKKRKTQESLLSNKDQRQLIKASALTIAPLLLKRKNLNVILPIAVIGAFLLSKDRTHRDRSCCDQDYNK